MHSLLARHRSSPSQTSNTGSRDETIICLVRPHRIKYEQAYWNGHLQDTINNRVCIKVMPYNMLDGGTSLYEALQFGLRQHSYPEQQPREEEQVEKNSYECSLCLYHVASTFGPTPNPIQTALDNVQSATDAFSSLCRLQSSFNEKGVLPKLRMVLTSSMAAVRATNQPPINGEYYTNRDWNNLSGLDENNWGSCYQWSKAESERQVLEMAGEWNECIEECEAGRCIEYVALCPSFVFGPPPPLPTSPIVTSDNNPSCGDTSTSYSIELVKNWLYGKSEVQSRLCIDVRDVALAHVNAGTMDLSKSTKDKSSANCLRYILSTEKRLSSTKVAQALKSAIQMNKGIDLSAIKCDTKFDGGAIKIGEKEVEASERLQELGVVCRSVEETMEDMAKALLLEEAF